jgi:hypothetical protein
MLENFRYSLDYNLGTEKWELCLIDNNPWAQRRREVVAEFDDETEAQQVFDRRTGNHPPIEITDPDQIQAFEAYIANPESFKPVTTIPQTTLGDPIVNP